MNNYQDEEQILCNQWINRSRVIKSLTIMLSIDFINLFDFSIVDLWGILYDHGLPSL